MDILTARISKAYAYINESVSRFDVEDKFLALMTRAKVEAWTSGWGLGFTIPNSGKYVLIIKDGTLALRPIDNHVELDVSVDIIKDKEVEALQNVLQMAADSDTLSDTDKNGFMTVLNALKNAPKTDKARLQKLYLEARDIRQKFHADSLDLDGIDMLNSHPDAEPYMVISNRLQSYQNQEGQETYHVDMKSAREYADNIARKTGHYVVLDTGDGWLIYTIYLGKFDESSRKPYARGYLAKP